MIEAGVNFAGGFDRLNRPFRDGNRCGHLAIATGKQKIKRTVPVISKAATAPSDTVRIYRENLGLTQTELGRKLGKYSRQKVSDIEHGKRGISKEMAKKLGDFFQFRLTDSYIRN